MALQKVDQLLDTIGSRDKVESVDEQKKSDSSDSPLFTKLQLGPFTLPNRIAMPPMTRGRATEAHVPTEIMATYYAQRSDALLITEGTGISAQGMGWYRAPGVWNNEQIAAWIKVTDAVHKKNGTIGCQLWHLGRQCHSAVTGQPTVSASALALPGNTTTNRGKKEPHDTPKALSKDEIKEVVNDYANAAVNAIDKAGFDFVEIHAANGYLIDQFLQAATNVREDDYGGTVSKRLRFMKEVVTAIIAKVDKKRVGIRLSPNSTFAGMGTSKDNVAVFNEAIEWVTQQDLLYIHLIDGVTWGVALDKVPTLYTLRMARDIMKKVDKASTALMGVDGYTKEKAEQAIAKGDADLIAFGRPHISNPDLVYRFKNGIALEKNAEYKYLWNWQLTDKGYIDWPTAKK
eukprot:261775_1